MVSTRIQASSQTCPGNLVPVKLQDPFSQAISNNPNYHSNLVPVKLWGEAVNLNSLGVGRGMKIWEYIEAHCVAGTPNFGSQLPIWSINNLSLKIIVLVLTKITGLTSFHQASRPLMFYVVEFLRPIIYD
jgi:hypothetical protein